MACAVIRRCYTPGNSASQSVLHFIVIVLSGLDCILVQWVQLLLPLLLLGPQLPAVLGEPAARGSSLLGSRVQDLVFLAIV